jgi:hypothetical protein
MHSGPLLTAARAELLSTVNTTIAPSLLSLPCRAQLNWLPQFSSLYPPCMDRIENTVSNNNSIVVEACLPIRCLETGCITQLFHCCVRVCCWRQLATAAVQRATAQQRVYASQYVWIFYCSILLHSSTNYDHFSVYVQTIVWYILYN